MAVIKEIELSSGASASYWKIVQTEIIHDQRRAILHWAGWITADARAMGKACIEERTEEVPVSDEAIATIYGLSLAVSHFASGEAYLLDPWRLHEPGDGAVE